MESNLEAIVETKIEEDVSLDNISLEDKPPENNIIDTITNTASMTSYEELNKKHQSFVQKNLKMSTDLINFRMKIEELENDNNSISIEKTQIVSELEKIKEERQQLEEECLGLKGDLKEVEGERDKLAGLINIMKIEWEKQYQTLKAKFQESELIRSFIESRVNELHEEHNKIRSERDELRNSHEKEAEKLQTIENQKAALLKVFEEQQNGVEMSMKGMAAEREAWQQREAELVDKQIVIKDTIKKKDSEINSLRKEVETLLTDKRTLKQKLIEAGKEKVIADGRIRELESVRKQYEKELMKLKDGDDRSIIQLEYSKKQIDMHKAQIVTLTKKLAEADAEKRRMMQVFQKTMETSERNSANLKNELDLMRQEKENLIRKKFHGNSINESLSQLETSDGQIINSNDKIDILEQRIAGLENSLKISNLECDQLRETLAQVQFKYLDAINDKDQLTQMKRNLEKKVKSMGDQLEDVLAKNLELVVQITSK
ncbi:1163_t:CDS:2 [Scutellospora calospora]|uniref:1163_t:CDS:1 n=1 Tax=Scutellospora calospora TaxID=85575 RepID=A0ACA9JWH2_9GLOM|nr:1163_t:CDS:2 [Scutellospora calospora]